MVALYLYGFNKYAGVDKVWKTEGNFKPGDLLQISDDFYFVLGKDVSFFEQYKYGLKADPKNIPVLEKKLLNKQSLELLHWMVYQRYSTYKNVVKLFLPLDIDKLIDKKITKKVKIEKFDKLTILNSQFSIGDGQTLIIFPDLRTLMNLTKEEFRKLDGVDTLLSTNTQSQKDKSWRNVKNGNTRVVLATHSEIFQNYKDLQKIIMVRPHKRYYANQQDPRYKTLDVVKKMAEIWDCELELLEI